MKNNFVYNFIINFISLICNNSVFDNNLSFSRLPWLIIEISFSMFS